jgi:hypothetical protein
MNLIAYEEEASNIINNEKIKIEIEDEMKNNNNNYYSNQSTNELQEIKMKIFRLNYLRQKTNFYYMLYDFDQNFGYFTDKNQKFLAGDENVYENFYDLCLRINQEFSARVKNGENNFKKFVADYSDKIKKLLNLINIFKEIYGVEESIKLVSDLTDVKFNFKNLII